MTNFRTSTQGPNRVLSTTVRFENKSSQPLTIGYVRESGVALDELGNRYVVPNANGVRAIGEIAGTSIDPKFTLQPGEASDARFELGGSLARPRPASCSSSTSPCARSQLRRAIS